MTTETATPEAAAKSAPPKPDRSEAGRKRAAVSVTVVLTVWGAIFLWVFSVYVLGRSTQTPPPRPNPGAFPGLPPGPAGPVLPPGGEEPGHEGHGHAPGEHGKH